MNAWRKLSEALKADWRQPVVLAGLLLLTLLVMDQIAPYRRPMPSTDSGIFLYMGDQLLEGKLLYKDAWDHKAPLVFVINALGQLIRPDSLWGVWLLQFIAVLGTVWLAYHLMSKAFGRGPALFGSLILVLGLQTVLDGGNLTEEYALPFQLASLWFFWKTLTRNKPSDSLLLGLFSSLAFWLRANIIGIPVAIGALWLWQAVVQKDKAAPRKIALMAAGWLAVAAVIFIWFAWQDNLPGLLEASFVFNFMYSSSTWAEKWASFLYSLSVIPDGGTFAIAGWVLLLSSRISSYSVEKTNAQKWFGLMLLILLPLELIFVNLSGRAYPHYFMSLLPVHALLSGYFLYHLYRTASGSRPRASRRLFRLALLSGLLVTVGLLPAYSLFTRWWPTLQTVLATGQPPAPRFGQGTQRTLAYLAENIAPNEYLVLWGRNLSFNWFTRREVPSRHLSQDYFFTENYATPEMIQGYIDDLDATQPVIIDTTWDNNFIPSIGTALEKLPEIVHPLYIYLEKNYALVDMIPGTEWAVYRFVGDQDAGQ